MNERIKELVGQAKFIAEETINKKISKNAELDAFAEKFAELIVRECMTMSNELKAQYLSHRKATTDFDEKHIYAEGEAACDTLKYKMKEHFGVEL
jgi:vacuolar-type H+-ATPase subunit H